MYMWGTDSSGSLLKNPLDANASKIDIPTAIENPPSDTIQSIICGPSATAFLLSNGEAYVAGENKQGQLGLGHTDAVSIPTQVPVDFKIQQIALGATSSAFVAENGDLYTCGFGGSAFGGMGILGHGNAEAYSEPKLVESLVEDGCSVQSVQVGESHMTVLTTGGEILTTGAGSYGRLGNFETTDQLYLEPVEVLAKGEQIAGGKSFTLVLSDGVVYGFGRNHKGQLGTGLGLAVDMYAMQAVPEPIESLVESSLRVTKIASGHSHAACLTESGQVYYWGSSVYLEPVRVDALLHTKIVDISCGEDYTLALDEDGKVYSFGKGKTGVLGLASLKQANQATLVEALDGEKVTSISAGWKHAACMVES